MKKYKPLISSLFHCAVLAAIVAFMFTAGDVQAQTNRGTADAAPIIAAVGTPRSVHRAVEGQDDATTAWISNSHPAYNQASNCFRFQTEDDLSSRKLGEARKRLRFTKGLNRIPIRLENEPSFARLSILLSPVVAIDGDFQKLGIP